MNAAAPRRAVQRRAQMRRERLEDAFGVFWFGVIVALWIVSETAAR
jgi:hypothetical protein